MRDLSANMARKLASYVQAGESAINANVWISRPTTQLTNDVFLEKQKLPFEANATKSSIAVCHPKLMRDATDIYVGYIDNGTAKIAKSMYNHRMENHEWIDTGFTEQAEDISLCFDGTMPKNTKGRVEFKTENSPWVFWVHDTKLYGQKLGNPEKIIIAEANCVAVSAIRAMWSEVGVFDFGLIVFFILGGYLYYRQYINGTWYDGEMVSSLPAGILWTDVSAFRTWDYRVGVQLVAKDGAIYELYTQFMGIGKQSIEHVELDDMSYDNKITKITYSTLQNINEHVNLMHAKQTQPYIGSYELGSPSLLSVKNVDDGSGDWGKNVVFAFDKELENNSVQTSVGSFYFIDESEKYYFPSSITMDVSGRNATLTFVDINNAVGECVAHYEPGTVVTMVGTVLQAQEYVFHPQNLVPNGKTLPEVVEVWNRNEIGTEIAIKFTEPLTSVPAESAGKFIVTISEPEYSPGGALSDSVKPVIAIRQEDSPDTIILEFEDGMFTSIRNAVGEVAVQYIGTNMEGVNGPVLGFRVKFLPNGLYMKPYPHDPEHVELKSMTYDNTLTKIEYSDLYSEPEHVSLVGMSYSCVLTNVNDL